MNGICGNSQGAVLTIVVAVLLCVSLMVSSLLVLPGRVLRLSKELEREQQVLYDGESRILERLYGIGDSGVASRTLGPWLELSTSLKGGRNLCVIAGRLQDSLAESSLVSRRQKKTVIENFRHNLNGVISLQRNLKIKSGNRRLMGAAESQSLVVQDGDLLVDYFGKAKSCNFKSSGSITVRGSASFDTLRLYASGPVYLSGQVRVDWLEAFSEDALEVFGNFRFAGAAMSINQVALRQRAFAAFPSTLLSLNASVDFEKRHVSTPLLLPANENDRSGLVPVSWYLR